MVYDLEEISLNKVCRVLSVLPELDRRKKYKQTYFKPICTVAAFISVYLASSYYKYTYIRVILVPALYYIDVLYDATLIVPLVTSVVFLNLKHGRKLHKLLLKLQRIDADISRINGMPFRPQVPISFYGQAVFIHVFLIAFVASDMVVWISTLGWDLYLMVSFRDYESYHVITLAMVLRYYALVIKRRFQAVNQILLETKGYAKDAAEIYTDLARLIGDYNEIFGWQFVVLYVNILVNLLVPMNSAIVYSGGKNQIAGNTYGLDVLVFSIFWGLLPILVAVCLYSAGESTISEAKKTAEICYAASHKYNSEADEKYLLQLAQEASKLNLSFSAAGYFTVSHQSLFELFGSVASYLIVIIQFNK